MSKESVIQLIELAENNLAFKQELFNAKTPQNILEIASQKGYSFTEAELIEVMQEKQLSFTSDEELSDEQLESVVGGKEKKIGDSFVTRNGNGVTKKVYRTPGGDLISKTEADAYYNVKL